MTVSTARLPAGSGTRGGPGLALGVVGLGLFGVVCGVGLAVGELEALVASLTVLACFAVLADFRIGAVLLLVMLPVEGSYLFPHSVFGVTGLNPLNLVLAATLFSYLVRGHGLKTFLPKTLGWFFILPIIIAGLLGTRHVDEVHPYFYEMEVVHFTDALGYLRDVLLKPMLTVVAALVIAQAVMKSKKVENFLVPFIIAVWVMSVMAIGYVVAEGVSIGALALTSSRTFFSALGMHANDLGRLYAVAYALLLFTWGETKDARLKLALLVSMAMVVVALILTVSRGA